MKPTGDDYRAAIAEFREVIGASNLQGRLAYLDLLDGIEELVQEKNKERTNED